MHDALVVEGVVVKDVVGGILEEEVGKGVADHGVSAHVPCEGVALLKNFLLHRVVVGFLHGVSVALEGDAGVHDGVGFFALGADGVDGGDLVDTGAGFHFGEADFVEGPALEDGTALVGVRVHPHLVGVRQFVIGFDGNNQSFKDVRTVMQRCVVVLFKVSK